MTPEEKQSELNRSRAIVLSTLDYLIERLGGSFVYDQHDPVKDYYLQQKIQTEKYYNEGKLYRLRQRLTSLTKGLQNRADPEFAGYIRKQTGYDIDIFEDLRIRVDAIIKEGKIGNQKEMNDVGTMLHYHRQVSVNQEATEKLMTLLTNYIRPTPSSGSRKRNAGYSEIISKVEKDGIETITLRFSTGPKPVHLAEQEAISPDGKRRLRVTQWSNGKHASTYVAIVFPTASGAVYGTNGIRPDVKASWKDNSTIVIETKEDCMANTKYKEVRHFDDVINIEYVDAG